MPSQVNHFPVSDVRRDMPNILSVGLMALIASLVSHPACNLGIRKIADPQFLEGASADNYGCYPVAESAIGMVFVGVILLQMAVVACFKQREVNAGAGASASMVASQVNVKQKSSVNYYFGLNALTLHLPRAILGASVAILIASIPWVHVALDMGVRFAHLDDKDPNAGEDAAAYWGCVAACTIPVFMFGAACLLPVIKNLRYAHNEKAEAGENCAVGFFKKIQRNLFVDQTAVVTVSAAGSIVQSI